MATKGYIYQAENTISSDKHRRKVLMSMPEGEQDTVAGASRRLEAQLKIRGGRNIGPNSMLELLESLGFLMVAHEKELKLDLRVRGVVSELMR